MAEGGYDNITMDPTSPYFLGSHYPLEDAAITSVKLNGENYFEWERSIRLFLRVRNKFGFVDGTIDKPSESSNIMDDWVTVNAVIVLWIMQTIEPEVKKTLWYYDDARVLWNAIKERYRIVNGVRWIQLKTAIALVKQTKNMSIATYYEKLNVLWYELEIYEPMYECKCGKCTCDVGEKMEKSRDEERVHQFLTGLYDEYYGGVRMNLQWQDPLPSLFGAYQSLLLAERFQGLGVARTEEEKVDKSGLFCKHCNRTGHDLGKCFRLNGYPKWWRARPRGGGRRRGASTR